MSRSHSSRGLEERLAPRPPVRNASKLDVPVPPIPKKKRKEISPSQALKNSREVYEKPLPERQRTKRRGWSKRAGQGVRGGYYGLRPDLEQTALDLLRRSLEGVKAHSVKRDILTRNKMEDRYRREVYTFIGTPLPHIRKGLYIRVATQVARLNSRDGVAQAFVSTGSPSFSFYETRCYRCTQNIVPPDPISYDYGLDDWVHEECV